MKLAVLILVALFSLNFEAFTQTRKEILPDGIQVLDISPKSELISCVRRGDPNHWTLLVLDPRTQRVSYQKDFGENFPFESIFFGERKLIVRLGSQAAVCAIDSSTRSIADSLVAVTHGEYLKVELKHSLLCFLDLDALTAKFDACRVNLRTGEKDSFHIREDPVSLRSYVIYSKDTLIMDFEDKFVLVSLSRGSESVLRDSEGHSLSSDGGHISLTSDRSKVLFASQDKLWLYDLRTRQVSEVMKLNGYVNPMLSPDGSFLILSKGLSDGSISTEILFGLKW